MNVIGHDNGAVEPVGSQTVGDDRTECDIPLDR